VTTFTVAYRATVYEPRSEQSNPATEPDILSPIGGAPHATAFKVATVQGLSGYEPVMEIPRGRNGELDLLSRQLDQGEFELLLLDRRNTPGGSNLSRFITTYFGGTTGRSRLMGCKVLIEEATDWNGTSGTWASFATGRIIRASVRKGDPIRVALTVRDASSELGNAAIFKNRPASSLGYVIEALALPLGVSATYGSLSPPTLLTGTLNTSGVFRSFDLSSSSLGNERNIVTKALLGGAGVSFLEAFLGRTAWIPLPGLRLRFTAGAVSNKEAEVTAIKVSVGAGLRYRVTNVLCKALASSSDPFYTAMDTGTIANGTSVTSASLRYTSLGSATTERSAILIGDVHPVQLWADILDGKFGPLKTDGTAARTFARNSSAFSTLISDTSFPLLRFRITKSEKLQDWVEKNLLLPFGLGMYVNGSGEVVPVDLRLPSSGPSSTTITDADLIAEQTPDWSVDRTRAVTSIKLRTYQDYPIAVGQLGAGVVDVPAGLVDSVAFEWPEIRVADPSAATPDSDVGERSLELDIQGLRTFPEETTQGVSRSDWVAAQGTAAWGFFVAPFGTAPMFIELECRRTANTDRQIGQWVVVDCDMVPDPATNLRGGARLCRVVGRTDTNLRRTLKLVDVGPNVIATAPSVATPAQEASNTQNGITDVVTLNGSSEEAVLWINPTATSVGSRPGDSDSGWRPVIPIGQTSPHIRSTGTVTVRNLPANKRIWVRVRTEPLLGRKLPSPWAYPAGTGYVDTATITAPTGLAQSGVTTKAATLSWTNGDAAKKVVLRRFGAASEAAANAGTPVDYVILEPGTTRYVMTGLDSGGPWWHCDVYHLDDFGGTSSVNNLAAFQATGTAETAPTPGAVLIIRDGTTSAKPPALPSLGFVIDGRPGIDLELVPAPTGIGLDFELERAPDSGGSPGTYAQIAFIPGNQMAGRAYPYRDRLPIDGATYWYRGRHSGAGVTAGGYTSAVSGTPGWLPNRVYGLDGSQPVLGQVETIRLPHKFFTPDNDTVSYNHSATDLRPGTANVQADFQASVVIPAGATIVALRARVLTVNLGDQANLVLYRVNDTPSSTNIASLTPGASASWQTISTTFSESVTATNSYLLGMYLLGVGSVADAGFMWAEIDIVRNSYRQQ